MRNIFIGLFVTLFLAGCGSTAKKDESSPFQSSKKDGKSIILTTSEQPDFNAVMPQKSAFGLSDVSETKARGDKIVTEHKLTDRASYIGNELIGEFADDQDLNVLSKGNMGPVYDVRDIVTKYGIADYVLDVRSESWGVSYVSRKHVNNRHGYWVNYSAKLRLVDVASKKVLAESICKVAGDDFDRKPQLYNHLLLENASKLKDELGFLADKCIGQFEKAIEIDL